MTLTIITLFLIVMYKHIEPVCLFTVECQCRLLTADLPVYRDSA